MGLRKDKPRVHSSFVLLILGARYDRLERALRASGYTVVVPSTPDQGVALCLQNRVAATLIDATTLSDENSWSLALSLKAVSPDTPVLLITSGRSTAVRVPPGVDCMASAEDPQLILDALKRVRRVNAAPSRKVSAHSCLET